MNSSSPLTTRQSDDTIAWTSGGRVNVGDFLGQVTALAERLPDHRYVINLASDRYEFLVGFCAAIAAGQCTLLPPNRQPGTLEQLIDDYPECYAIGQTDTDRIQAFDTADFPEATGPASAPEIPDGHLCAILFTSGSTGASTPNPKLWHTLRDGAINNTKGYGLDDGEYNLLATVPAQHSWGLETSILVPLFSKVAVAAETPFFPDDIASALEALPGKRVLVSSPVHLHAFLQAGAAKITIDRILSATAPMPRELAQGLEERFGSRVTEVFGCSEAGSLASRRTATQSDWEVMDAFEFDARAGKVRVRAAHLPETVVLSDRIEMLDGRRFRWLGRDQDMINIAGKRGSLAHLNVQLSKIRGVVDGVIFLPDDDARRLAALVVAPGRETSAILSELREFIEPAFLPRPLYKVPMLPRQETGKIARKAILDLFNQQKLAARHNDEDSPKPA